MRWRDRPIEDKMSLVFLPIFVVVMYWMFRSGTSSWDEMPGDIRTLVFAVVGVCLTNFAIKVWKSRHAR